VALLTGPAGIAALSRLNRASALAACLLAAACGKTPSTPSPAPNPNQVTITAAGAVTPAEIVVAPGARVLFTNQDSRRHHMASDPHPEHNLCTEINAVGLLQPGESRETGNLVTVRTCGYHDHENPDDASLKGRIVIAGAR
jgi:plastocyanin